MLQLLLPPLLLLQPPLLLRCSLSSANTCSTAHLALLAQQSAEAADTLHPLHCTTKPGLRPQRSSLQSWPGRLCTPSHWALLSNRQQGAAGGSAAAYLQASYAVRGISAQHTAHTDGRVLHTMEANLWHGSAAHGAMKTSLLAKV
jgi:hypothetical protein